LVYNCEDNGRHCTSSTKWDYRVVASVDTITH
jgi:hypothetical protein